MWERNWSRGRGEKGKLRYGDWESECAGVNEQVNGLESKGRNEWERETINREREKRLRDREREKRKREEYRQKECKINIRGS